MEDKRIVDLPEVELLSSAETRHLLKQAQQGNEQALDRLVEHNLRLVLKVTYRYKNTGYELQDLFQIGVIGLIKAIKAFDLERENKFSTYAFSRIIGEIRLHLRDDGIIKISRKLKKIARILRKKKEELKHKLHREPSIKELVEATGYKKEEIIQAVEADKNPASLYCPTYEKEGDELLLIDNLAQKEKNTISPVDKINLEQVINELDDRSRKIIYFRYFKDLTQQEIGQKLGISQVQVSRLEKKILGELKEKMS